MELNYPGDTQLRPDLWVLVPVTSNLAVWHALEIERSAFHTTEVGRKITPSRVARDLGEEWLYLWVTGKGGRGNQNEAHDREAAHRFMEIGSDLDQLVIPTYLALRDGLPLTEPVWHHRGNLVPITHLTREMRRIELVERMGLRVW